MRKALFLPLLALAACGPGRTCEEAFRQTRVTIHLQDSTRRSLLDGLERRTGFPIARRCDCGMLQEALDRPGFNLSLADVPARAALHFVLIGHCGGWAFECDRVVLHCGLPTRARPREGWLRRVFSSLFGPRPLLP